MEDRKENRKYFVRESTGLIREVGGFHTMVGNVMVMGLGYGVVFAFFAQLLYPGVDLPYTVAFALVIALLGSGVYYLFSVAMPRTGGDFVWVSRILHPAAGFVANLLITFTLITTNGVVAAWIVIYGLAPMFYGLGLIYSNPSLMNLATTLSTLPDSFIISLVILSVFITPLFSSTKNVFRYLTVIFGIALASTLILIGTFLSTPNAAFISNFNNLSGMNYAKVISTAGLPSGFLLSATLTGGVFTIINFLGFNNSAYYGGEIIKPKSSQLLGMFGASFLGACVMGLLYASAYNSVGPDFLNAVSFLYGTGSTAYTLPAAPTLNFLAIFANPNPFVVVVASLALIATSVGSISAFTFVCVRNMFAWSFDRILPSFLTKVDSRGSPYVSVIVVWIISALSVVAYYYTAFFQFYIYSALAYFIAFGIVGVAAIVFPYTKRELFESAPDVVKKRLGGVPLISILGVGELLVSIFIAYSSVLPSVTPPPTGAVLQVLAYTTVPLTIVSGLVIYAVSYFYRKSKGMDLDIVFKEIPPE